MGGEAVELGLGDLRRRRRGEAAGSVAGSFSGVLAARLRLTPLTMLGAMMVFSTLDVPQRGQWTWPRLACRSKAAALENQASNSWRFSHLRR